VLARSRRLLAHKCESSRWPLNANQSTQKTEAEGGAGCAAQACGAPEANSEMRIASVYSARFEALTRLFRFGFAAGGVRGFLPCGCGGVLSARRNPRSMRRAISSGDSSSSWGLSVKRTPNPPGRCISCNSLGLTREHMWADWLRDYIPRERIEHYTAFKTFVPDKAEQTLKRRTGDPHSTRIKCVCRKCNNEWMGKLQENAKPYLVPMLEGKNISLFRNGQNAIAAWATMMVMVSEYLEKDQGMVAIPSADRHWLYKQHRPPSSRWRIWIGQHRRQMQTYLSTTYCRWEPKRKLREFALKLLPTATRKPRRYALANIS
jgi:hypothetical protein